MARRQLPIDVRLLEPFVALAKELHFTRAAASLHVAQPALSQQIARLEREVGSRLFTRPPEVIALTPAGEALLRRVRPALTELHGAVEDAREVVAGRRGSLSVGHASGFSLRAIPAVRGAFQAECPDIVLQTRQAEVDEQVADIRNHTLDLGLFQVSDRLPWAVDLSRDVIVRAPLYILMPPGHPLALLASLTMEQLAEESWVVPPGYHGNLFRAVCARHGFTPRIAQVSDTVQTIHGLVAAGFGIGVGSWLSALRPSEEITVRPVSGEELEMVAGYLPPATAAATAFIRVARDVLGRMWSQVEGQRPS